MNEVKNYEPNSYRSKNEQRVEAAKTEEKRAEKVVVGNVQMKKKSEIQKLADSFFAEDIPSLKNYVIKDVLVPAIKDALEDIVTNGIRMLLRGETGSRKSSSSTSTKVSYRSYYDSNRDEPRYSSSRVTSSSYDYGDFTFERISDAEEVLNTMFDILERYHRVRVADLYELMGLDCNYTDNKYGWTDLRDSEVYRVRGGYKLKLPKASPID